MRTERDSLGAVDVPDEALYGASTARAIANFPISGHHMPLRLVHAIGLIKRAAAHANTSLDRLPAGKADWIQRAATEVAEGRLDAHFPVDVFQTGSGTSTNTNANEVITNRVNQLAGVPLGSTHIVHPNDDVNMGQSSNDVMPSALHVSVAVAIVQDLIPALRILEAALQRQAAALADVIKIGRTHLMDATPMTLGQEFSGYAAQVTKGITRAERAAATLEELAIGGTAVGTGINTHPAFAGLVCERLRADTGIPFREAANHFEAQGARDDCAEVAGILATIAAALTKIANDIRWLSSGPRSGLAELQLPATQPGSSIMPGKVNPVMSEMVVQVGLYVQGLTQTAQLCARDGQLELNATIPLLAHTLHEATGCLANAARVFATRCVDGIEANRERCAELVERSLMLVTALAPVLGYDVAASVAKEAHATGRTLREVVLTRQLLTAEDLDRRLDPRQMLSNDGTPLEGTSR
ncbi:MAG: fumarate hydratase class II [Acidimicrobiia bacterium]